MMDNDLTPQILRRAYEIWENEGRPHGRDKVHWFLAEAELSNGVAMVAEPMKPKRKPPKTKRTATKRN